MTDSSEPNDMSKSESYKNDPEGKQKSENLDGNPNIEDGTKSVEMNRSTADDSEPNDMPKAESYKDDRMEVSKSGPEGKQKGGNLDGNPNIEDETKNVEVNQSPSGVANDAVMSSVSPICFYLR